MVDIAWCKVPQKLSVSTCYHRNWNQLSSCYLSQRVDDFVIGQVSTDVQAFHSFVYHKTLCPKWHFQTYQEETWASWITVISLEKLQTKLRKVVADIKYIITCKKERLIPTFAKVNISIKNATHKFRRKLSLLVMNNELEKKHLEKRQT